MAEVAEPYVPDPYEGEEEDQVSEPEMNSEGHISMIGHGLERIPIEVSEKFPSCSSLDLSHNSIMSLKGIEMFKNLKVLVMDENRLDGKGPFPPMPKLNTLSVNSNDIADLESFIKSVCLSFPALTFLSLLKNEACPNFFTGKEHEEYQRYRYFVVANIPKLKFLDSSPVTPTERKEAARVGHLMVVARPDPQQYDAKPKRGEEGEQFRPLPQQVREPGAVRSSFGVSRYIYYGRQSEGNRFITNNDL